MSDEQLTRRLVVSANDFDGPPEVREALRAKIKAVLLQAGADAQDASAELQIEIEILPD